MRLRHRRCEGFFAQGGALGVQAHQRLLGVQGVGGGNNDRITGGDESCNVGGDVSPEFICELGRPSRVGVVEPGDLRTGYLVVEGAGM